jgi:ubiquinone/menaquinone biosynthesis C-methylase UbiE
MSNRAGFSQTADSPYWKTMRDHEKGHMLACKLLAKQMIDDYRITEGVCIDLGSGEGWIGMELAKHTDMTVHLVDLNLERLSRAAIFLAESDVRAKVHIEQADAQQMPFGDDSIDLIVCRGAVFFWEDPAQGFKEVYRLLRPAGVAFIGGSMGRYMPVSERKALVASIEEEVRRLGPEREREWWAKRSPQWFKKWLGAAGIEDYKLYPNPPGIWVEIRKARDSTWSGLRKNNKR